MNTEHTNQSSQAEPAPRSTIDLQSIPERQRGFTAENIRDIAHECMRIGDNEQAEVVFAIADALCDGNLIIQPAAQQQAEPGVYAILYRDNWDGEGDTYHTLATRLDNGAWLDHESGASLLKYEGDAILRVWPLTDDKAQQQADPVARDVLMALAEEVHQATKSAADAHGDNLFPYVGWEDVDLAAIVDRYAAQPPAVAVAVAVPDEAKQRIGEYLTDELPSVAPDIDWYDGRYMEQLVDGICAAMLAAAPQAASCLPAEMTPAMMRAVQMRSELGAYAAANLAGAYDLFAEFWRVAVEEVKKGGAKC